MEFFCKIVDQEQIFFIMIWYPHGLIQFKNGFMGRIKRIYNCSSSRTGLFCNDMVLYYPHGLIQECRLDFTQSFVLRKFAAQISIPAYTVTAFYKSDYITYSSRRRRLNKANKKVLTPVCTFFTNLL